MNQRLKRLLAALLLAALALGLLAFATPEAPALDPKTTALPDLWTIFCLDWYPYTLQDVLDRSTFVVLAQAGEGREFNRQSGQWEYDFTPILDYGGNLELWDGVFHVSDYGPHGSQFYGPVYYEPGDTYLLFLIASRSGLYPHAQYHPVLGAYGCPFQVAAGEVTVRHWNGQEMAVQASWPEKDFLAAVQAGVRTQQSRMRTQGREQLAVQEIPDLETALNLADQILLVTVRQGGHLTPYTDHYLCRVDQVLLGENPEGRQLHHQVIPAGLVEAGNQVLLLRQLQPDGSYRVLQSPNYAVLDPDSPEGQIVLAVAGG